MVVGAEGWEQGAVLLGALFGAGRDGMGHGGLPRATNLLPLHMLVMEGFQRYGDPCAKNKGHPVP